MSNFIGFTLFTIGIAVVYFILDKLMLMLTKKRKQKREKNGNGIKLSVLWNASRSSYKRTRWVKA